MSNDSPSPRRRATMLAHAGREHTCHGEVNPPVHRASTMLARSLAEYESGQRPYTYGTHGTPTTRALEETMAAIEGAHSCRLAPSGLLAITATLMALTESGGEVLVPDAVYGPTRRFMDERMARFGVAVRYYPPRAGAGEIDALINENTAVLFLESPCSNTMEIQDVPALAAAARRRGVVSVIDNTWSAGWYFNALEAGCDISIQAATKYQCGHSDVLMGAVCYSEGMAPAIEAAWRDLGICVDGDSAYLVLRGLRTMDVRLSRHMQNAIEIARWLEERPEVEQVLHPALPSSPDHQLWKRDFTGAPGLFSFVLAGPLAEEAVHAFVDSLKLFGIGASWGGYESLVLRFDPRPYGLRSVEQWPHDHRFLRVHVGLEDPSDLVDDLQQAFERMKEAI